MSARLPRLAVLSLSAAVGLLALGVPTAALAAPGGGPEQSRAAELAPHTSDVPAVAAAASGSAASPAVPAGGQPDVAAGQPDGTPARAAAPAAPVRRATPAVPQAPAASQAPAAPQAPSRAKDAAPAKTDPRGNNGTFKVDGPVLDTSRGNEPHVTCAFRLSFFGYDAGQLAGIVFTAVAPTPGPTTRVEGLQLISSIPAKGGAYGGSYPATGTLTAADLGLDGTQPQHVKVSVTSYNADGSDVPGGAKHKVFWLEPCATAAVSGVSTPATSAPPAATPASLPVMGPLVPPTEVVPAGAQVEPATPAPVEAVPVTEISGSTVSALSATPVTLVALPAGVLPQGRARVAAAPATLPFTGSPQLIALLVGGLVAVAGGAALTAATRTSA